jgi:hypothetical protein
MAVPQGHTGQSESMDPTNWDDPLAECFAYKSTRFTDLVVKRRLKLYRDRVATYHLTGKDSGEKAWQLDRGCKLEPEYVDELVKCKRTVRPPRTWTVTATVRGQGEVVNLVCDDTKMAAVLRILVDFVYILRLNVQFGLLFTRAMVLPLCFNHTTQPIRQSIEEVGCLQHTADRCLAYKSTGL